jgi:hypothetical protein
MMAAGAFQLIAGVVKPKTAPGKQQNTIATSAVPHLIE